MSAVGFAKANSCHSMAALFKLEQSSDYRDIIIVVEQMISWLDLPAQDSLSKALAGWFDRVFAKMSGRKDAKEHPGDLPAFGDLMEVKNMLAESIEEWRKKDVQRGIEQGIEIGDQRGRIKGREEGREEERIINAANFKRFGVDFKIIAKATGLTIEQIEKL